MGGVISATIAICLHVQAVSRCSVFLISGIHLTSSIDHSLRVNVISFFQKNTAHKIIPLGGSVACVNRIKLTFGCGNIAVVDISSDVSIIIAAI
jgi:hypothetical protein